MFEKIIRNKHRPGLVVIQDSNSAEAASLFKGLLKGDIEDDSIHEIHLICCEYPPKFYLTEFVSNKLITYDMFRDPCNWIENGSFNCDKILMEVSHSGNNRVTLMMDSINLIIMEKNLNYLCSIIHTLKEKFNKVTCLLNGDLLKKMDCEKIFFFSDVYIKLLADVPKYFLKDEKHSIRNNFIVEGIEKKSSGKILSVKEIVNIDSRFNIHSKIYDQEKQVKNYIDMKESMKGLTTFRMGLNIMENEKIAKDNLVLPYLRKVNSKENEGKIVYYADSGDDLEEDPDEDLDI